MGFDSIRLAVAKPSVLPIVGEIVASSSVTTSVAAKPTAINPNIADFLLGSSTSAAMPENSMEPRWIKQSPVGVARALGSFISPLIWKMRQKNWPKHRLGLE
jgi:hypothetical protein